VSKALPLCALAFLAAPACLYPPASYVQARRAAKKPAAAAEANAGDVPAPAKPTGPMIADGTKTEVMNLQPGGGWFVFHDPTPSGVMTPPSIDKFATALENGAIHTTGRGFIDWGGGIGFNFQGAGALTPIDASDWKGISFKAWGNSGMHMGLATMATLPDFNICKKCYDHYAVDIYLTPEPREYSFTWDELRPGGWGTKVPLDLKTVVGLNFTAKNGEPWDFTIDDLKFIK
jgi:hypothetical protein